MSQEKFEAVRQLLAALNARDVDAYFACCTDDVELVPVTAPIEGGFRGRRGIERFFADLRDTAPDFEVEAERLKTVGQHVLAFERGSARGRASEVAGDIEFTTVYEFRGRKISRVQVFLNRKNALEALGLSEQDAQSDIDVVRRAYAAISERDFDALAKVTDAEMVLDFSRSIGPEVGVYGGREGIARFAAANEEVFERFELLPIEFVVGPRGQIVARHRIRAKARRGGLELDRVPDVALVWELRDGKVTKATLYQGRSDALEAAGLSE